MRYPILSFSLRIVAPLGMLASSCAADESTADVAGLRSSLDELPVVSSQVDTPPLHGYDDAPRAVDSDDPAIWVHPTQPGGSLVIGALKNAGLQVYTLTGTPIQTIVPPNHPPVSAQDPRVPGPQPDPGTSACPESTSGETYGRFNNLDVQYDVEVSDGGGRTRRVDVVVVSDRGCDRVRFYGIDVTRNSGPLYDLTAPDVPRVFPKRFVQPSPYQPGAEAQGVHDNPLDDQSTVYGLTLQRPTKGRLRAFVTQRSRTVAAELEIIPTDNGRLTYQVARELRFPAVFDVPRARGEASGRGRNLQWTPCREDPTEDPQFEGLVVDQETGTLYAAQEAVGVWELPLSKLPASGVVTVDSKYLIEKTRSFGAAYWAIPDDDEFSCEVPEGTPPAGAIVVNGNVEAAGKYLQADVEGLAIYYAGKDRGYLIISSQGDDTFHVYSRKARHRHLGTFKIDGTGETDGHDLVNVKLGSAFPSGLFVAQNGQAPAPASTEPVNGYDYDNSTQFRLLDWADIAGALDLIVDTDSYDPRKR